MGMAASAVIVVAVATFALHQRIFPGQHVGVAPVQNVGWLAVLRWLDDQVRVIPAGYQIRNGDEIALRRARCRGPPAGDPWLKWQSLGSFGISRMEGYHDPFGLVEHIIVQAAKPAYGTALCRDRRLPWYR